MLKGGGRNNISNKQHAKHATYAENHLRMFVSTERIMLQRAGSLKFSFLENSRKRIFIPHSQLTFGIISKFYYLPST